MKTTSELCKAILLEQAFMTRKYVESQRPKPQAGFFGIIKGDTITYQDTSGTVTTTKLNNLK